MNTQKENKKVIMMVGGPGAGKSYIRKQLFPNLPVLDCDQYKKDHPDFDPQNITKEVHEFSAQKLARKYFAALAENESFVYDGTGTNLERYIKWINHAHEAGFEVKIVYVACDLQTALKRNRNRERFVPENIVKDKHSTVEISFEVLKKYADRSQKINNS